MAFKGSVQFANFICRFGEKEMLDLCEEVVLPAFRCLESKRSFKDTSYFFFNVELVSLVSADGVSSELAIAGRFVKNTILKRNQVFEEGKLVKSHHQIPSAPSALFVLTLSDHKLMYIPEVSGAPTLESFKATAERFIVSKHTVYIKGLIESRLASEYPEGANRIEKSKVRKEIVEANPKPTLNVVSLASEENFNTFVDRFDSLDSLSIKLLRPNNEIDNDGFFKAIRDKGNGLGASGSSLNFRNTEGLEKEKVKEVASNALDGNTSVRLSGTDKAGAKLSGTNEDFKLQVKVEILPKSMKEAAQTLYGVFLLNKVAGHIKTGGQVYVQEKAEKLLYLAKKYLGGNND